MVFHAQELGSYAQGQGSLSCLCSRSQPGIKVIIRDLRGHLLYTVTFLVSFYLYLSLDVIGAVYISLVISALISIFFLDLCRDFLLELLVPALPQLEHLCTRRLVILLPPILTFPSCLSRASDMIRSRKILKRVGDRRHPCPTPTIVLNHSPMLPFIWTALVALL